MYCYFGLLFRNPENVLCKLNINFHKSVSYVKFTYIKSFNMIFTILKIPLHNFILKFKILKI